MEHHPIVHAIKKVKRKELRSILLLERLAIGDIHLPKKSKKKLLKLCL